MKTIHVQLLLLSFIIFSCSKQNSTISLNDAKSQTNVMIAPGGPFPIGYSGGGSSGISGCNVVLLNGNYIPGFGGGVIFGSCFPYPLNVAGQHGQLFNPAYIGIEAYGDNPLLSVNQTGPYITVVVSKYVTSLSLNAHQVLSNYYEEFGDFVNGTLNPDGTYKQPNLPTLPSISNTDPYTITYQGTFMINEYHTDTHVIIADGIKNPPLHVE